MDQRVPAYKGPLTPQHGEFWLAMAGGILYKDAVMSRPGVEMLAVGGSRTLVGTELAVMKRYTGQKALYEAIARTRAKSQRRGILERLYPGGVREEPVEPPAAEEPKPQPPVRVEPIKPPEPKPVVEKPPAPVFKPIVRPVADEPKPQPQPQPRPVQPWLRPKAVQLHDGRIEISLPYTLGVTVLLVAILLVLGAFRLGQAQRRVQLPAVKDGTTAQPTSVAPKVEPAPARAETPAPAPSVRETPATDTGAGAATTTPTAKAGDNVIVLARHAQSKPLEAVQAFYKEQGIDLEVIVVAKLWDYLAGAGLNTSVLGNRDGYMLVTKDYYDNPENPGTNGFRAKQKIIEIGKGYKNPLFAPRYFSDAYGMKIRKGED